MLQTAFNEFKVWAKILKDEEGINYEAKGRDVIQIMADGYCLAKDTGDERRKNMYIAGLMLRFWYVISKLKVRSPIQGLDYIDFMGWLYEAIEYACKYRAWQKPEKKTNAQQAINKCIETIRVQKYYDLNLQKNRANINTYSLDAELDSDGKTTLLDTLVDEGTCASTAATEDTESVHHLIQMYINKKKLVEAIILDTIAFNDTQKTTKKTIKGVDAEGNTYKYTQHSSEFWPFRCVQILSNLPENYAEYFHKNYSVPTVELEAALNAIRTANNQKLYRFLSKTLTTARDIYQSA